MNKKQSKTSRAVISYDLYRVSSPDNELVAANVQPGYTLTIQDSGSEYFVRANNDDGTFTDSNTDTGYSTWEPGEITDFNASDDNLDSVICTWSHSNLGNPECTYDLYRDSALLASDISSGYNDTTAQEGTTYTYYIQAINSCGSINSNEDTGEKIPLWNDCDPFNDGSLLYYWNFDNTLDNFCGEGTWTSLASTPLYAPGVSGESIEFVNGESHRLFYDPPSDTVPYKNSTFNFFMKVGDSPPSGEDAVFYAYKESGDSWGLRVRVAAINVIADIDNSGNWLALGSTVSFQANFRMISIVLVDLGNDSFRMDAYVDGLYVGNKTDSSSKTHLDRFHCGANNSNEDKFDGYIDEFTIYNRVLTEEEIQEIYNHYLGNISN